MNFKKTIAAVLTAVMCTANMIPAASAANIYSSSSYLDSAEIRLAQTLSYSENTKKTSSGSYRQDFIFTYAPGSGVVPVVAYGDTIYGRTSIEDVAADLRTKGNTILAGVNADFFSMTSGVPEGLTVTEGVMRSSDSYQSAVGFMADGSVLIGKPQLKMTLISDSGYSVPITYFNKVRTGLGVYLLNSDYREETGFSRNGTVILLRKLSNDAVTIGGAVPMVVDSIRNGSDSFKIPEGYMVLTVSSDGPADKIAPVQVGDTLTFTVSSNDKRWNDAVYACGAGDILIENGSIVSGLQTSTKPRTVLGVKADGSLIIMAIDGSQSKYSVGVSLKDIAAELSQMGCISAVNLDGGGSTTAAVAYPGKTKLEITNSPSGGSPRSCSTYLFFVNRNTRSHMPSALHLYPINAAVLTGGQISYETTATDSGFYPASVPGAVTYSTQAGTFSGTTFTAGNTAGVFDVFAYSGNLGANAKITVINDTDRITVTKKDSKSALTSLSVAPGDTIDLNAHAYYFNRPAYGNDTSFTWSVTDNIGYISPDGVFTAAGVKGLSGNITVSYGSKTVSIPVTVGRAPITIEPFDTIDKWNADDCTLVTDYSKIKYGSGAVSFSYDLTDAALSDENLRFTEIIPAKTITLAHTPDYINVWIYSDGSGNRISVNASNSDGQILSSLEQYPMDTVGWKHLSFTMPSGAAKFVSIVVTEGGKKKSGTVIADQMIASYAEPISGNSMLSATFASVDVSSLIAFVSDASGNSVKTSDITLQIDGDPASFTYDMASGLLQASYHLDDRAHRITLIAKDSAGNLVRTSKDITAAADGTRFADMKGHWAAQYADFLSGTGVITGVEQNGTYYFNPSSQTTRTEMAVIIARYLGLDITKYESVKLPFDDNKKIAAWALPYIKAVYAEGLMSGVSDKDKLYFNPTANITRVEALTILGRTIPQGYASKTLTYKDTGKIAAWALPHFEKLVALGIVGGYTDNTIKPLNPITRAEVATMLYRLY